MVVNTIPVESPPQNSIEYDPPIDWRSVGAALSVVCLALLIWKVSRSDAVHRSIYWLVGVLTGIGIALAIMPR